METLDCIKTRRSRRLFTNQEIEEKDLQKILKAGIQAPSSMDCQPWHFIIVREQKTKERLSELKGEENKQHILTAPLTIVVCVDTEKSSTRYVEDGVTATENILLAAHDLGLGSVYITGDNPKKPELLQMLRKILSLPRTMMPITILPLGYPEEKEKLEEKTLLNLKEIIHEEKF